MDRKTARNIRRGIAFAEWCGVFLGLALPKDIGISLWIVMLYVVSRIAYLDWFGPDSKGG